MEITAGPQSRKAAARPIWPLARLLWSEFFTRQNLPRVPESDAVMDAEAAVRDFHSQGVSSGPMTPVYEFNARAASRLVPRGGRVLDLGAGSGNGMARLALGRPDLEIVGIELSPRMVEVGNRALSALGLYPRARLVPGDMTNFRAAAAGPFQLVVSQFALHHLPDAGALGRCLDGIAAAVRTDRAAFWLFDHARPRSPRVPALFPEVFTPNAPEKFKADSRASLAAAWRLEEVAGPLGQRAAAMDGSLLARWLPFYQCHWRRGEDVAPGLWRLPALDGAAQKDYRGLSRILFPGVPQ